MIDKNFWNRIFQDGDADAIFTALGYILALCLLAIILPRCVPDFAAVTALPPFFSQSNERIVQLVACQVVDAKMVAARAQMQEESKEKDRAGKAVPAPDPEKEVKDVEDTKVEIQDDKPPKDQNNDTEDGKEKLPLLEACADEDPKVEQAFDEAASNQPPPSPAVAKEKPAKKGFKKTVKQKGASGNTTAGTDLQPIGSNQPIGKSQE